MTNTKRRAHIPRNTLLAVALLCFFAVRILFTGFVSAFLMDQGASAMMVSLISSGTLLVSFAAVPLIGRKAERLGIRTMCSRMLLMLIPVGILFAHSRNPFWTAILYALAMCCINALHPLLEKLSTAEAKHYGSVRIWGTIGHALGTQLGGILYHYISPRSVYYVVAAGAAAAMLAVGRSPVNAAAGPREARQTSERAGKAYPGRFWHYLAVLFCFYAVLDTKNLYLTPYLRSSGLGIDGASTVLFAATLLEIPVIFFGGRFVEKTDGRTLLLLCTALIGVQTGLYAISSELLLIVPATLAVNSVVSMLYIMVNIQLLSRIVGPDRQISALTITAGTRNLAAVIGQTCGGYIWDRSSCRGFFLFLTCIAVLAALLAAFLHIPPERADMGSKR